MPRTLQELAEDPPGTYECANLHFGLCGLAQWCVSRSLVCGAMWWLASECVENLGVWISRVGWDGICRLIVGGGVMVL